MNYQNLHDAIINHARINKPSGHYERHHIIPRCIGGTDEPENLIDVTYRQHFILHWLWTKLRPDDSGLNTAFHLMFYQNSDRSRPEGEILRRNRSRVYARNKAVMSQQTSDRFKDVPKSEEQRVKMRLSAIARWQRPGQKERQSKNMLGNQLGKAHIGKLKTDQQKQKQSVSMKKWFEQNEHPQQGKHLSEETKQKISQTKKDNPRVYTEEQKLAVRLRQLGTKRPESQKKAVAQANSKLWEVTTPDGQVLTIFNLRQYCLKHGLSQSCLVSAGKTKGYAARKLPMTSDSTSV